MNPQKLKDVRSQMVELSITMKGLQKSENDLQATFAIAQAKKFLKSMDGFLELFTTGVVREAFEQVIADMVMLEEYDPNYKDEFAGNRYGIKGNDRSEFYAELFGGLLRSDADMWQVLEYIGGRRDSNNNPFTEGE